MKKPKPKYIYFMFDRQGYIYRQNGNRIEVYYQNEWRYVGGPHNYSTRSIITLTKEEVFLILL